eukprot:5390933-Alexandrium_andersonii.AAC.1
MKRRKSSNPPGACYETGNRKRKAPRPLSARSAARCHDRRTPRPQSARPTERSSDRKRGPTTVFPQWFWTLLRGLDLHQAVGVQASSNRDICGEPNRPDSTEMGKLPRAGTEKLAAGRK